MTDWRMQKSVHVKNYCPLGTNSCIHTKPTVNLNDIANPIININMYVAVRSYDSKSPRVATIWMSKPMIVIHLRPYLSARKGTIGSVSTQPAKWKLAIKPIELFELHSRPSC